MSFRYQPRIVSVGLLRPLPPRPFVPAGERSRPMWFFLLVRVTADPRPNHFGPFLIALTESWKEDCKCYGSFSESDLKRIEQNASCAISIHSSFLNRREADCS